MARNKEDKEHYGLSALISVALALLIHWLFLSRTNLYPTLHAALGIGLFFIMVSAVSSILKKIW